MADALTKLSSKYKCDKSDKNHRYTPLYHNIFEPYRDKKFYMLEYGYGLGSSVKMWLEYFTKAKLLCIDIGEKPTDLIVNNYIKKGRLEYLSSNQIDKDKIIPILKKYKKFLFIIDDASHVAEDQQFTFNFSFPFVSNGGWYIIEDLKCKRNHNKSFQIEADKTLVVLNNYLATKKFNSKVLSPSENLHITNNIESLSIHDKISFIKKKG